MDLPDTPFSRPANAPPALRRAGGAVLVAALAAFAAGGCRSESQPATGAAGETFFPLVQGARWLYSISTAVGSLRIEVTAMGEQQLPRDGRIAFVMDERNLGPSLGFDEVAPVAYVVEEEFIARINGIGYDSAGKLRALGQSSPTRILPVQPRAGQSWGQQNTLFDTPEGGGKRMTWSGDVREGAVVTVPAGTFEDVIEVVTRFGGAADGSLAPDVVYHDVYARGIGLVRSLTIDPAGDHSNEVEQVLLEYHFPGP